MSHQSRIASVRRLLILCVYLVPVGCSDFASAVREFTYPPDFNYVSPEQLRSDMDELAYALARLDAELNEDGFHRPDQRRVLELLRDIEQIAGELQAGSAGASHPFLEDDMPGFINNVTRARLAASLDPPQYYLAGRIAGACLNCHKRNR